MLVKHYFLNNGGQKDPISLLLSSSIIITSNTFASSLEELEFVVVVGIPDGSVVFKCVVSGTFDNVVAFSLFVSAEKVEDGAKVVVCKVVVCKVVVEDVDESSPL